MTNLSDLEVISGFQNSDSNVESIFYKDCYRYFREKFIKVLPYSSDFAGLDDLFQDSFLLLWDEIQTKKIHIRDNHLCRFDKNGVSKRMTASLQTYLMSIVKYKNFEMVRESELYVENYEGEATFEEEPPELCVDDVVSLTVNSLPQRCKEILTLFYYERKSLDEILLIRRENTSKDGLKSGKSKCLAKLKEKILVELNKYHLKICLNE